MVKPLKEKGESQPEKKLQKQKKYEPLKIKLCKMLKSNKHIFNAAIEEGHDKGFPGFSTLPRMRPLGILTF